jgi:uncharacterized damage-inducible protein DinB
MRPGRHACPVDTVCPSKIVSPARTTSLLYSSTFLLNCYLQRDFCFRLTARTAQLHLPCSLSPFSLQCYVTSLRYSLYSAKVPMNPLRIYDYLTLSRARIFDWVRPLTDEQYRREFPIGLGSLARILTHIMICEWSYIARLEGRYLTPYAEWPIKDEQPPPFPVVESTWTEQAAHTHAVLVEVDDWNRVVTYQTLPDFGPQRTITTTPADLATQIFLHEVHHRAQVLNILRQLGVATTDIDFNSLMKRQSGTKD